MALPISLLLLGGVLLFGTRKKRKKKRVEQPTPSGVQVCPPKTIWSETLGDCVDVVSAAEVTQKTRPISCATPDKNIAVDGILLAEPGPWETEIKLRLSPAAQQELGEASWLSIPAQHKLGLEAAKIVSEIARLPYEVSLGEKNFFANADKIAAETLLRPCIGFGSISIGAPEVDFLTSARELVRAFYTDAGIPTR